MPKTIAVDLDEVLGKFVEPLCQFHNERYGTSLSESDFFSYAFADVWGGTSAESTEKVHAFFDSPFFEDIPRVPGALQALQTLKEKGYDLVIVTSRQLKIEKQTREWTQRHYPDIFREIAFGNHWGVEGRKITKRELCSSLGATILIDDSLSYAREAAEAGLHAILFDLQGKYGWNKLPNGKTSEPPGVIRLQSWDEILANIQQSD